jgi:glycosyltransferase involved in cell wall biosynthesis
MSQIANASNLPPDGGPIVDLVINGRFLSQRMTGVQRVAREFVSALDRMLANGKFPSLRVRLVAQNDADTTGLDTKHIEIERLGKNRGHVWEQITLPKHLGNSVLLCLGNTAPIKALLRDQPVAVFLHDLSYRIYPKDYTPFYRYGHLLGDWLNLRRAHPLITVSDAERTMIAGFAPQIAARIVVAPNGGWSKPATPKLDRRPSLAGDAYGLYVGSLSHRKNTGGIIATAIDLAIERGIKFRFVGPVTQATIQIASSIPAEVRPLITFRGYVDDAELSELYREAAFLLYPSFHEASGLPPVEAMAFGCPVVTSNIPVMRERCGDAAEYCEPVDHDSIKSAVLRIIDNPDRAKQLALLGLIRAQVATWDTQVSIVIGAILASVADNAGQSRRL